MPRGAAEVADVFRRYGQAYRQQRGDCYRPRSVA